MSAAFRAALAARGRLLLAGALFGLVLFGALAGQISPHGAAAIANQAIEFLRDSGAAGPALFAALQLFVAVSGAVPASALGVAAGALYGLVPGFLLAALGSLLGAVIAFALSRSLFRSGIERLVARHSRLQHFDDLLRHDGWKLVCLLRLSPVMPFSATSYVLGLSSIGWSDYLAGTLAALPALALYVVLGTLTKAGLSAWAGGAGPVRWMLLGLGGVAILLLMPNLRRIVGRRPLGTPLLGRDDACGE